MMYMHLGSPLTTIKGVGEQTADHLLTLGLETVEDLIYFFPRKYDDFSRVIKVVDVAPGNVTLKARVESVIGRYVKRRMHITEAILDDGTAKTKAVWFNQPYRAEQLTKGEEFYFSGTYDLQRNSYVLSNPSTEKASDFAVSTARIVPIYSETKGLKSFKIRRILSQLIPVIRMIPETLPGELIQREKLIGLADALYQLHFPETTERLQQARERMGFEEVLELMTAAQLNKRENAALEGYRISFDEVAAKMFTAQLSFEMTGAQKRAAWEVFKDFGEARPMNRLLQGDVGSGKTVVAAMAAFMATKAGYQTAFMAPTEILATQHAETIAKTLEPLGVRVGLLIGSVKSGAKKQLQERISAGELDVIVGTHALIQRHSQFKRLGFVVVDEQHRFGVAQRAELLGRSRYLPHLLSMTATPIPRSLQLTLYGELEVSILDELPKGRQPIITKLFSGVSRKGMYGEIDKQLAQGRQAYVVCPVIGEGAMAELKSVEAEYERLKTDVFPRRKLAKLHGKMKAEEKDDAMKRFKAGEFDILVATTVVEVGVDVPNATIMLIEGAERFGLAQLHQLRGRVGRGEHQSYCYLAPSEGKKPSERLYELEKSQDGFYLAEVDLRLRGPGEIYGRVQHGVLNLRIANLADVKLLKKARAAADWLLGQGVDLVQYKQFYKHVGRYRGLTSLN
jgi:ATP-dependent DNA helicase RecG